MLKEDKMVNGGASGCTNRADKNSNIIISYNDNVVSIWQHIQNTAIFNAWGIFKTLSKDHEVY